MSPSLTKCATVLQYMHDFIHHNTTMLFKDLDSTTRLFLNIHVLDCISFSYFKLIIIKAILK